MAKRALEELERTSDSIVEMIQGAQSIESAGPHVLQILGEVLGCEWGSFWKVNVNKLLPAANWSAPSVQAPELDSDTRQRTLSMSEGTAGHVWRSRKPVWTLIGPRLSMCGPHVSAPGLDHRAHQGLPYEVVDS